jgi:hypothetical protein
MAAITCTVTSLRVPIHLHDTACRIADVTLLQSYEHIPVTMRGQTPEANTVQNILNSQSICGILNFGDNIVKFITRKLWRICVVFCLKEEK